MNKKQIGKPVDLSGININELEIWLKANKMTRKILICLAMTALNRGAKMTEVCNVLNITREGVRLSKNQLRWEGIKGLLKHKKAGK